MKLKIVFNIVGKILLLEAAMLFLPLLVSLIYKEPIINKISFLITICITVLIGILMNIKKAKDTSLRAKEGFAIVSISWIIMSVFGALPFYISKNIPNYFDALFEISSGFTTTGASIVTDLSKLAPSMLFWRAFSHWLGGMGVLVLILAFIPESKNGSSVHIIRAESTGPQVGKLVSKVKLSSRILYIIYFVLTIVEFLLLLVGPDKNIGVLESLILSFSTAGTGGFSVLGTSISTYSSYTQYVIAIFMYVFAINFTLYFLVIIGKWKDAIKSEELKWFLIIIAISVTTIIYSTYGIYGNFEETFRYSFFQVGSIMSTTGFATTDFANTWPALAQWTLVILMFCGACAGSTGGGIKISRVVILVKNFFYRIKKMINPRRTEVIKFERSIVDDTVIESTQNFFIVYMIIIAAGVLVISFLNKEVDFTTNFTGILSCISNVGPAFGRIGTFGDFSFYSNLSKVIFSLIMIAGRLEIFPILILFSPAAWRKN